VPEIPNEQRHVEDSAASARRVEYSTVTPDRGRTVAP
jgi:hypothetical protein